MADFIDSIRQNPVAIAVVAVLLGIMIWYISKQVKGGRSLGTASGSIVPGSNIDPNTGLPYVTAPGAVNNFTSYPIVQTLPGVPGPAGPPGTGLGNPLAYIRSRFSNASVASYDQQFAQGVPIRDLNGNVIGNAPYGQSIQVTGNPIAGSSNLPGTQAGAVEWLPVTSGSQTGYVSSFDLTGLQAGATLDQTKTLTINGTPVATTTKAPTPVKTTPVAATTPTVTAPAKVSAKYVTVKAWPDALSTLSGIASANGKSLSAIELLNPQISNPNSIYAGQQIRVS